MSDKSERPFPAATGSVTPEEHERVLASLDHARMTHPRNDDVHRWERHLASIRREN